MINIARQKYLVTVFALALGYSCQALAQEYVPPPAGPYKPEVVVSDAPAFSSESAEKVYKFPSEDLIRSDTPPPLTFDAPARSDHQSVQKKAKPAAPLRNDSRSHAGYESALSSQNSRGSRQTSRSMGGRGYDSNPWSPNVSTARPQLPAFPAYSDSYPSQQNGYGYPQQYPYGYGAQGYYGNTPNDANTPFFNMTSPWNMMPMQPFFPGR